ncbi:MAG: NrsF family protein [Acidobacteria bacterium]|nr:NrsF family protein [Acidobacteriota bacterium]
MNCGDIDRLLTEKDSAEFPLAAGDHLQECERCRQLVQLLESRQQLPSPSGGQVEKLAQMLTSDLEPVKPLPGDVTQFGILAAIALAALAAGGAVLGLRGWDALQGLQRAGVFVVLALMGVALAASLTRQMAPGSPSAMTPAVWAVGLGAALAVVVLWLFDQRAEAEFVRVGLVCLQTGLAVAACTGLLLAWALRRGAMLSHGFSGSTAGALAGLTGLAVLELQCPNLNAAHILAWHLPVVVFSSLAGLVTGLAAGLIPAGRHRRRGHGV